MNRKWQICLLAVALALALVVSSYATSFTMSTTQRHACGATIATNISSGHLRIYSGTDPGVLNAVTGTLLVDWTLNATNTDTGGVTTLGAVTNVNASATNTAAYFRITESDGATALFDGDCSATSGSLTLNTLSIVSGGPCSLSGTITVPIGS
jgi:hypothetical protein